MRPTTPAFSRRQRPGGEADDDDAASAPGATPPSGETAEPTRTDAAPGATGSSGGTAGKPTTTEAAPTGSSGETAGKPTHTEAAPTTAGEPTRTDDVSDGKVEPLRDSVETQPISVPSTARPDPKDLPEIEPPDPKAEPWPDATPPPMRPVEPSDQTRPRPETVAMPTVSAFGAPPEMPKTSAPPPLVLGEVENPAHMPGPRDIPGGSPDDPAPAPGHVTPGDSRSLRREGEFALIYRVGTCVISRTGRLGTRGQWRVVEYPTSAAAANSYAKECSRFVSEGFSDYRE